jgi:hypothetical protein
MQHIAAQIRAIAPAKRSDLTAEGRTILTAAELLARIPVPETYDEWAQIGLLVRAYTEGHEVGVWLFDQWSQ